MAKTIDEGVVDGELRVHGVRNLRVIDASIDPVIPDCRPQQVVYMTAEKVCRYDRRLCIDDLADFRMLGIGYDQACLPISIPREFGGTFIGTFERDKLVLKRKH